jgi:hypothetical protein
VFTNPDLKGYFSLPIIIGVCLLIFPCVCVCVCVRACASVRVSVCVCRRLLVAMPLFVWLHWMLYVRLSYQQEAKIWNLTHVIELAPVGMAYQVKWKSVIKHFKHLMVGMELIYPNSLSLWTNNKPKPNIWPVLAQRFIALCCTLLAVW